MDNIKWGPERQCTGEQPCPDWVLVRVKEDSGDWSNPLLPKFADWNRVFKYHLPAEYEALLDAKEPTHEQMLETLAARYEDMPTELVGIEPAGIAYNKLNLDNDWYGLPMVEQGVFRAMFKAGQEHGQKHSS